MEEMVTVRKIRSPRMSRDIRGTLTAFIISVHSSAGFSVLPCLTVTLLVSWQDSLHSESLALTQGEPDALGASVSPKWPFTNN